MRRTDDAASAVARVLAAMRRAPELSLQYEPLPSQRAFHEAESYVKGFCGGVGSGKSMALCVEGLRNAYASPGSTGLIAGPTYSQLADTTLPSMYQLLEENGVRYREHKQRNKITLTDCGSEIFFRSMDDPNRIRGLNLNWAGCDELTYCKREAWDVLFARVRIGERRSRFAGFTPNGRDWVWNLFASPERSPEYLLIAAKPFENTFMPSDYWTRMKTTYSADFYRQEALGEFIVVSSNQAYREFDRMIHVKQDVAYRPFRTIFVGLDFNVNPMSVVIAQERETAEPLAALLSTTPRLPVLNVLDEVWMKDSSTWRALDEAWDRISKLDQTRPLEIRLYGDASAGQHHTSSGSSDLDMIKRWAATHRDDVSIFIDIPPKNPYQRQRVNSVNSLLKPMEGQPRLFVHPCCEHLVRDLEQVVWDQNGELDKDDPELTHISDALGYLIWKRYGWQAPRPDTRKPLL